MSDLDFVMLGAIVLALTATGRAVWAVGFSRRWKEEAKQFLADEFGPGPNDDDLVEIGRQNSARWWLGIAAVAWGVVALVYRQMGGVA